MGLAIGGVDVLNLTNNEIPTQEIEDFFWSKASKNGYKYDRKVGAKVAKSVLELYKHVIGKRKVTSGQINKCFARGVDSWLKHGTKLDSLQQQGAIFRSKYRRKQQRKKFPKTCCCEP